MAQAGNQNASNGKRFRSVLIERIEYAKALPKIVDALIAKAIEGDMTAIKEVSDRMDGKAMNQTEHNIGISVHVHRALEDAGATIEHEQTLIEQQVNTNLDDDSDSSD